MISKRLKAAFDPYYEAPLETWERFASHCEEVSYKKNEIIKEGGKIERYGYFLLEGAVGQFVWKKNNYVCLEFFLRTVFLPTIFPSQQESQVHWKLWHLKSLKYFELAERASIH